jgi:DNA-binding GntR family transcriptional regulator
MMAYHKQMLCIVARHGNRKPPEAAQHRPKATSEGKQMVKGGKAAGDDNSRPVLKLLVDRPTTTLRELVVAKLRTAIMEAHFPPGERLVERRLCALLGVSRTLVREALRQLEAEGWIDNVAYRGPTVTRITAEEAQNIYDVRIALEGRAAQLFAERATDVELANLNRAFKVMAAALGTTDLAAQRESVEQFYAVLLEGAHSPVLVSYVRAQRSRLVQLRSLSLSQPQRSRASLAEKRALMRAILARDGDAARRASDAHLTAAAAATAIALACAKPASEPSIFTVATILAPDGAAKAARAVRGMTRPSATLD